MYLKSYHGINKKKNKSTNIWLLMLRDNILLDFANPIVRHSGARKRDKVCRCLVPAPGEFLRYSDPDGNLLFSVVAIAVGGVYGLTVAPVVC